MGDSLAKASFVVEIRTGLRSLSLGRSSVSPSHPQHFSERCCFALQQGIDYILIHRPME